MPFIYYIADNKKTFTYKGKRYTTPCKVVISSVIENRNIRNALSNQGIKNVKVERSVRRKVVPLGCGDGKIKLNALIQN